MTTNKPEVVAYRHINKERPEHRGVSLHHDASCTSTLINTEPLIRLSDYEALQAECEKLRKDAERYRFARAYENDCFMLNTLQVSSMEDLDAAIDDAMREER